MYKILIYGNYTYRRDLEKDSFVEILRRLIPYLSKRYDVHFTILVPQHIDSIDFPNVEQRLYSFPTYPNLMRQHFDTDEFLSHIDWRNNDFDILYSHLPEHTSQLINTLYNFTNINLEVVGYSHWFETSENASQKKYGVGEPITAFNQQILGTLFMKEMGVNSNWLKQKILKDATKNFSKNVIQKLDKIIQPHYLGVDRIEKRKGFKDKTIIFNHRGNEYTGVDWFREKMDILWAKRQDFKVYTTLTDIDREWSEFVDLTSRDDYMEFLANIKFGVGCFERYSAWSISTTDGLSVGVPYILPRDLCYEEMLDDKDYPYFYKGRDEFLDKVESLLDEEKPYDTSHIVKNMSWDMRFDKWFGGWKFFDEIPFIEQSRGLDKIQDFVRIQESTTKREIMEYMGNWGMRVKFNTYREAMRRNKQIKLTKDTYEWVG